MTQAKTFHPAVLAVIIGLYIIAGLIYSISTPFLDVSDEVRHYAMVEQLAQGRGLPIQDPAQHGFYEQEGSQPPLYYAAMALVALPFDRSDFMQLAQFNVHALLGRADATSNFNQLIHTSAENFPWRGTVLVMHLLRVLGVLMGAVTVVCTYGITCNLVGNDDAHSTAEALAPLVAAALTAFNPMFVFIMASVNNDTLATMLSSLGLLLGMRIIKNGLSWRNALALGLILGCAALSKSSALALAGMVPLAIFTNEWLRLSNKVGNTARLRATLLPIVTMITLVLVIAGWWYVRNAVLYQGDFTGTSMMATIAGAREQLPSALELIGEWDGFRKAYLGLFGAVNIPMTPWSYAAFDVVLVVAGIGLLLQIRDWFTGSRERSRTIGVIMCFGTLAIACAALIRWTSITLASQGRLLFPVIAVISAFIAIGLARSVRALPHTPIISKIRLSVPITLCAGLAFLTFATPWFYIRPAYATPPLFQNESQLPADLIKTELRFEDSIRWIGFKVETPRVRPGDEFIVTLYWQGLNSMVSNNSAFIRLYGHGDTQVALLDTYPGGGMWPTSRWQTGEIIADRYRLRIPNTLTNTQLMPTALWLDAGFWNFQTKEFMKTFDGNGNETGRQRYEAGALAMNSSLSNAPASSQAHLVNANASITSLKQDGEKLAASIHWTATADFGEDYTVFAHLFNANGEKVAQADGRAAGGAYSARWWRAGDQIQDDHLFELPAGLPPGEYVMKYGLYKPVDGSRMPGFDSSGQPINDAALTQTVTIVAVLKPIK